MKLYHNIKWMLAGLILMTAAACKTNIDTPKPSSGSADFSKYIAVGNSLTSGYADGGLYLYGQQNSFPSIIAQQMKLAGGGEFNQPLFDDAHANGSGYLSLTGFNPNGTPILTPVTSNLAYRDAQGHLIKYSGDIENLGIPGMRLDLGVAAPTFSALNPFFERLLPDAQVGNTTYLSFASGRNHTFFSLWLGNNDVLGWATNGGVINNDPTKVLTSKANFAGLYATFVNTLTAQGQKGVVATIPDVTAIPYFNTVTVAAINAGLKANPQTAAYSLVISALDPASGQHVPRLATPQDLLFLTFNTASLGVNGYGLSPLNPIKDEQVLDKDEVAIAQDYVASYNTSIKAIATSKGLAVFDAYAFLNQFKGKGTVIDGVSVNSSYIRGNIFSLDGVHLTPMGYAIAANGFIKSINETYGSNIPSVAIANYSQVKFP
ncbi:MAG: G-D-S-L family lipolytic protein [Sphingobacteriales bacterium]|nr:G-D-S-L family lipolytic protein [Sphingobacteriales bacterium]